MRAFLALLASLVVTITFVEAGKGLLGAQKCTWGPSYWCQGLKESSECSATKHCIRKYWNSNPQKYQGDDDDVCQICKNMVKEARDQLLSNETQVGNSVVKIYLDCLYYSIFIRKRRYFFIYDHFLLWLGISDKNCPPSK